MHDEVTGGKAGRLGNEILGAACAPPRTHKPVPQNILFADERGLSRLEAALEPEHRERNLRRGKTQSVLPGADRRQIGEPVLGKHMRQTDDGFRIAEEDLRLRGEGDVLGTRQSGMPGFRIVRIETHAKFIGPARDDARLLLDRDPGLASPRGEALRSLLYLFERDEAIRLIRAG